MVSGKIKRIGLWGTVLLCIMLAAIQSRRLSAIRTRGMPEAYAGYTANPPPALNFVMAGLGGFRGIVSEILWFRAERLQEENRYLELVQLSYWLTMLDPYAAETWAYNAWNLAYNVSVMMIRPEDRLRWVSNGISLLRDNGLRMNPKEARLYRELAWMYLNKIGGNLDEAHATYQKALANEMAPLIQEDGAIRKDQKTQDRLATLKLDPAKMEALEKRFGALDWKRAESHALYWSMRGLAFAAGTEELLCRRIAYQSLILTILRKPQTAEETGKFHIPLLIPTLDFIYETEQRFPSKTMSGVYVRFLSQAALLAEESNLHSLAETFHKRLLDYLPAEIPHPTFEEMIQTAKGNRWGY